MCIGIPGQIRTIDGVMAKVEVCGIQREVDLTWSAPSMNRASRASASGCWSTSGLAMSVINEAEARDTLDALQNMFEVEPDVGALLYGEER